MRVLGRIDSQIKQRTVEFDREAPYVRSTQVRDYADTGATLATTTVARLTNKDVETLWGQNKPGASNTTPTHWEQQHIACGPWEPVPSRHSSQRGNVVCVANTAHIAHCTLRPLGCHKVPSRPCRPCSVQRGVGGAKRGRTTF